MCSWASERSPTQIQYVWVYIYDTSTAVQKHMQTCMHTANDALVDIKIFGMGGMWKSQRDLCACTKRLSVKVFDPLSGWFTQWLLLSPNLAAIKEVQLLLFSQSNLCTGKKSRVNQGQNKAAASITGCVFTEAGT